MNQKLIKEADACCIVCDKAIEPAVFGDESPFDIPSDAVVFQDGGNYGSAIHDSLCSGIKWEVLICDECLTKKANLVRHYNMEGYIEERDRKSNEILQELKDSGQLDKMLEEAKKKVID